jgi:aspartate aminotransferase
VTLGLARRVRSMQPSATIVVNQRAAALRAKGADIIGFEFGEPDFPTPLHIREAAASALIVSSGYTNVRGTPALLEAIRDRSAERRGVLHPTSEIVCSVGAKHTLFNLALVLFDPGDEVIVPAPYWVSYPEQVALVGAVPVVVPMHEEDGFRLTPAVLEAAITERTKAVILCSPSNPTGAAYGPEHLRGLADVLVKHPIWVIIDEIYGELVYDGFEQLSLAKIAPELRDRLIIVDGVSKTYAMTGWRIGWALAPASVAAALEKVQGQSTTSPTAIAQHAATAALRGGRESVDLMREAFAKRRRVVVDGLNAIDGVTCRAPDGAFYAFPNVTGLMGRQAGDVVLTDDVVIAAWLIEAAGCALVPGSAFGAPGYLRMSYATSMGNIEEGLRRIRDAVAKLG